MRKICFALRIIPVLVLAALLLASCGGSPKNYVTDDFMIALPSVFSKTQTEKYAAAYTSQKIIICISKDSFDSLGTDNVTSLTPEVYAASLIVGSKLTSTVQKDGDLVFFEYTSDADGQSRTYCDYVYKGPDAFWLVQFVVKTSALSEKTRASITSIAGSFRLLS